MAETMFGDIYDQATLQNRANNQRAMDIAQLNPGRGSVYLAGLAGGGLMKGIGDLAGVKTNQQIKTEKLNAIMQEAGTLDPNNPEHYITLGNRFIQEGFPDIGMNFLEKGNQNKSQQSQTTYMQDIRDIAQFQLACDFNDPECAKAAQTIWQNQKRAGVDERGDVKYIEEEMEAFSQSLTKSTDDYQKALYYGNTIDQSLGFLDSGLYTGTGAETVNKFKQFGMAFGMVDPGATATAEQFKVNSMKAIMAWVQKTKGAISEAEMELFANASEGLARSKAGNKLILMTAKSLADYQKNLHRERLKWERETKNPTRRGWLTHKANWDLENANTVPSAAEVAAVLGSSEVQSKVIENDNIVITEVPFGE